MRVDFADVAVDTKTREITRGDQPVHLSPKAFELLLILIESRPQAVAKRALHDRLWPDTFVVEKNLANLVAEIRKAIGDTPVSPRFLRTVQRFGYALRDDSPKAAADGPDRSAGACVVRLTWAERSRRRSRRASTSSAAPRTRPSACRTTACRAGMP